MKPASEFQAPASIPGPDKPWFRWYAAWVNAMRLRTLPLALSGVGMGNLLALQSGSFDRMTAMAS
ncbi:MAG: hypothetical protein KGQ80_03500, partial [Bacteroidetes bacterium]|nr:hypothetical protein [Bacteroidota bacterium]